MGKERAFERETWSDIISCHAGINTPAYCLLLFWLPLIHSANFERWWSAAQFNPSCMKILVGVMGTINHFCLKEKLLNRDPSPLTGWGWAWLLPSLYQWCRLGAGGSAIAGPERTIALLGMALGLEQSLYTTLDVVIRVKSLRQVSVLGRGSPHRGRSFRKAHGIRHIVDNHQ